MARRDNALAVAAPLTKSIIFAIFGLLILGILWIQFGQIRFTDQKSYSAVFTSANGMHVASPVTVNGVAVGRVDKVEVVNNNQARATFTMDGYVPVNQATLARIRYKNLTGDQYLDLTPGPGSDTAPALADGGELPISNTTSSLDIDALLNGFNPLLQGLQPEQVNQVAAEIVTVLQGQGGTINQVLAHVASFSGSLAQQDKLIGSVIGNLNAVLGNLDTHSQDLSDTFRTAQELISKLNGDRNRFGKLIGETATVAYDNDQIYSVLNDPDTHDTLHELGRAMHRLNQNGQELDRILRITPGAYLRLGRLSIEQAGYQLGICRVRLRLTGLDGNPYETPTIGPSDNTPRCSLDNIAPLQGGEASWGPQGPQLPSSPWDLQQTAAGAQDQTHRGELFNPTHEQTNGNGR